MTLPGVMDKLRSPEGKKLFRYSLASAVAVIVSIVCLVIFNGVIGITAWLASTLATGIAAVPNYWMNRTWAWGKTGRSHLWKEVVPFWALAFAGWGISTIAVDLMESYAKHQHFSHVLSTSAVAVVYIAAFGTLWVAKFVIFNKILFVHHLEDLPPELDGRSGIRA